MLRRKSFENNKKVIRKYLDEIELALENNKPKRAVNRIFSIIKFVRNNNFGIEEDIDNNGGVIYYQLSNDSYNSFELTHSFAYNDEENQMKNFNAFIFFDDASFDFGLSEQTGRNKVYLSKVISESHVDEKEMYLKKRTSITWYRYF